MARVSHEVWAETLKKVARECSAETKNLPKGQRWTAYHECLSRKLKAAHAELAGK